MAIVSVFIVSNKKYHRYIASLSLALLALIAGLQDGFGNDYLSYKFLFERVAVLGTFQNTHTLYGEIGWLYLNWLFKGYGFEFFHMLVVLVQFFIIRYVLFSRVPKEHLWIPVIYFVLSPSLFLVGMSALRQTLAACILFIAIHFLTSGKILKALVAFVIAPFFHLSSLLIILLVVVRILVDINKKTFFLILGLLFILGFIMLDRIALVISSELDLPFILNNNRTVSIGFGVGLNIIYYMLLFTQIRLKTISIWIMLYLLGILTIPLSFLSTEVNRFLIFTEFMGLIAIVELYKSLRGVRLKVTIMTMILIIKTYDFYMFFKDLDNASYLIYKSIL